eukprot:SM000128S26238  [mRNA]  locus=s128:257902:261149:- [translate_table: standard]
MCGVPVEHAVLEESQAFRATLLVVGAPSPRPFLSARSRHGLSQRCLKDLSRAGPVVVLDGGGRVAQRLVPPSAALGPPAPSQAAGRRSVVCSEISRQATATIRRSDSGSFSDVDTTSHGGRPGRLAVLDSSSDSSFAFSSPSSQSPSLASDPEDTTTRLIFSPRSGYDDDAGISEHLVEFAHESDADPKDGGELSIEVGGHGRPRSLGELLEVLQCPESEVQHRRRFYSGSQLPAAASPARSRSLDSALKKTPSATADPVGCRARGSGPRHFTYHELRAATDNFSRRNLIGRGGFSDVFKGQLQCGKRVAVKRLLRGSAATTEGVDNDCAIGSRAAGSLDILREVGLVSHVQHPNATALVGYSVSSGDHLLVYELMSRGSLKDLLHRKDRAPLLWRQRLRIATGTARGLDYLHSECPRRIIHRDIKAANILIDRNFHPQVADFGLAAWAQASNDASEARQKLEAGEVEQLADPRMCGLFDLSQLRRMALAACLCLQDDAASRPRAGLIAELLATDGEDVKLQHLWLMLVGTSSRLEGSLRSPTSTCGVPTFGFGGGRSELMRLALATRSFSWAAKQLDLQEKDEVYVSRA